MHFLWKNKLKLFTLVAVVFIFSLFKLSSSKIFFDTERIINDISKEVEFTKLLNDENLIKLSKKNVLKNIKYYFYKLDNLSSKRFWKIIEKI